MRDVRTRSNARWKKLFRNGKARFGNDVMSRVCSGKVFANEDLSHVSFSGLHLDDVCFWWCDMRWSHFESVHITRCDFYRCKLTGAWVTGHLSDSAFRFCHLQNFWDTGATYQNVDMSASAVNYRSYSQVLNILINAMADAHEQDTLHLHGAIMRFADNVFRRGYTYPGVWDGVDIDCTEWIAEVLQRHHEGTPNAFADMSQDVHNVLYGD